MRIDYTLYDLKVEKYTEQFEAYFELFEDHFHWKAQYYADVLIIPEDMDSGFRNVFKSFDNWVRRTAIMGVGMAWLHEIEKWQVYIECTGLGDSIDIYFEEEDQAVALATTLTAYMLNKPLTK